jgi:segregation and condensation protein A
MNAIGEEAGEGTEIQSISLFKLMKTFEKVMRKMHERNFKPQHVVFRYNYTMEESRAIMIDTVRRERTMSFEKIFIPCENRIHAIFLFLSILELAQQQYLTIMVGEGRNNLLVEWNQDAPDDLVLPVIPPDASLN